MLLLQTAAIRLRRVVQASDSVGKGGTPVLALQRPRDARAIRFYEKHGFAISGEETNPRSGAPVYRMSWRA